MTVKGTRTRRKAAPAKAPAAARSTGSRDLESVRVLRQELDERITSLTESNRQLKRKIFDLYTIFEISRNFNAVLEFQTLLDTFILTSLAQVGASKGVIFLRERGQAGDYVLAKKRGSGDFPSESDVFAQDSKLAVYLTKLNRPVVTSEIMDEIAGTSESRILQNFHPGLIVPLVFQSNLSGLMVITDKVSGRDFTMDDIEFLSILGSQISVAIENARLYEAERTATRQLRAAQQQLVNTERLAALGEMSAKIAHEINNPLGIIKNYILLLRRSVGGNPEVRSYADVLGQEIDRIARIVRELLDFHRPRPLVLENVCVTGVINDVLALMERQIDKRGIKLVKDFVGEEPPVLASPENLKQVFMNIIINASDAMPDGGTLRIETGCNEAGLVIRFSDTGPGIPPEIVPRIFEPFFTTKEPGKGTGLGLSVCYGIMKQHKGTITYKNLNPGGCFELTLPVVYVVNPDE
jgi:signal transduction histidine kinase